MFIYMEEILYNDIVFPFGIDPDTGDYGYIKAGADTVTPFKSGSLSDVAYAYGDSSQYWGPGTGYYTRATFELSPGEYSFFGRCVHSTHWNTSATKVNWNSIRFLLNGNELPGTYTITSLSTISFQIYCNYSDYHVSYCIVRKLD